MGRSHFHPHSCKVCGKRDIDGTRISQTGLCPDHSKERFADNLDGLKTMSGPFAHNWRRAMAACVGAALLDEAKAHAQTGTHER